MHQSITRAKMFLWSKRLKDKDRRDRGTGRYEVQERTSGTSSGEGHQRRGVLPHSSGVSGTSWI